MWTKLSQWFRDIFCNALTSTGWKWLKRKYSGGRMNFDVASVMPIPSNWFSPNVEYEGRGRADFANPKGFVEGNVKVSFNEHGEYKIRMDVETWETEDPSIKFAWGFLQIGGGIKNTCTKLIVTASQGVLSTDGQIFYSYWFDPSASEGESEAWVEFKVRNVRFESGNSLSPVYWVLPLSNYLSDFMQQEATLACHTLRIIPSSEVPGGLSDQDNDLANFVANQKNRLIVFRFNDDLGFIEPLPDYEARKQKLTLGHERNTITAVMVGAVAGKPCGAYSEVEPWFPIDFLHLLGIATGSEVGSPWIELRSKNGELVRRIHIDFGNPTYVKGHRAIDEAIHRGTGQLLTRSLASPYWGTSTFRVVLRHILRGGYQKESMLEDRFIYMCRSFETLCRHFGLDTQELTAGFDPVEKSNVKAALKSASQQISAFRTETGILGNNDKLRKLTSIEGRVLSADGRAKDFGLAVCELLRQFSLLDADIIDAHYANTPRADGKKTWSEVLSFYRGSVIHEGYFDMGTGRVNRDDAWAVIQHLHDLMLRLIFKMIGYDGLYNPTMSLTLSPSVLAEPVDWVQTSTPITKLGYS